MKEIIINIEGVSLVEFFGINNEHFKILKRAFPGLKITHRGNRIHAIGGEHELEVFQDKVENMMLFLRRYGHLSIDNLENMLEGLEIQSQNLPPQDDSIIVFSSNGNPIRAKTPNQKRLVEAVNKHDIVFAIGPAGTGKTYTAVALGVRELKHKTVKRIILTRPAIEAGESLGFLPGDLKEKIDPYLRPLYDALDDLIPRDKLKMYLENRTIEIAPLAYMRGRTLNNAFIILDEAQNATQVQMKMFLTRLGPSAKYVVTGDLSQVDLPHNQKSGLRRALDILRDIEGISVVRLTEEDVVRHRLVKEIIKAYDRSEEEARKRNEEIKEAAEAETKPMKKGNGDSA